MTEQYQCQSYAEDGQILNCTCGKYVATGRTIPAAEPPYECPRCGELHPDLRDHYCLGPNAVQPPAAPDTLEAPVKALRTVDYNVNGVDMEHAPDTVGERIGGFEDALDWAFSQIIAPDNMAPNPGRAKGLAPQGA